MELIRKDAIGFIYGISAVLLGSVFAYLGYMNHSPFHVFVGSAWILIGFIAIVYIANHWLRERRKIGSENK